MSVKASLPANNLPPSDALTNVLKTFATAQPQNVSARDRFLLAVSAVQLAQRSFTGLAAQDLKFHATVSSAISKLAELPWNRVNFPIANVLLSQTYADIFAKHNIKDSDRPQLLLESLFTFLNVLETNPELGSEEVFRQIIESEALAKPPAASPVELNYRANVLKIFAPASVPSIDLEPLQIVIYRGELVGGGFGPELWGLAYSAGDGFSHVLLETGEYLRLPDKTLCLAASKDYSSSEVPPYLLACARLFFPDFMQHLSVDKEIIGKLEKNLGTFTEELTAVIKLNTEELANCETVLDNARWSGDHAGTGEAIKAVNIANQDFQIVITARQAAIRPYITSMLTNAKTGLVLMRLDTPREFSAYGIYLYPVGSASSALICYPAS